MIQTTGLESVAAFMQRDFIESGCPAKIYFGAQYLTEHAEELRVIFVPTNDGYSAALPTQARGPYNPNDMTKGANPRAILRRVEGAELHLWGFDQPQPDRAKQNTADFAIVGALVNQTLLSLHRANPGNYQVQGGRTAQQLLWMNRGFEYVLNITVEVPIVIVDWNELVTGLTWESVTGVTGAITVTELDTSVSFVAGTTGPTGPTGP
jgi:hypothetical protein